MLPAVALPAALEEYSASVSYFDRIAPELGASFQSKVDAAVRAIQESPNVWPSYLHGTRKLNIRRFHYGVVYWIGADSIIIVAIVDLRRRPGYWADRLRALNN